MSPQASWALKSVARAQCCPYVHVHTVTHTATTERRAVLCSYSERQIEIDSSAPQLISRGLIAPKETQHYSGAHSLLPLSLTIRVLACESERERPRRISVESAADRPFVSGKQTGEAAPRRGRSASRCGPCSKSASDCAARSGLCWYVHEAEARLAGCLPPQGVKKQQRFFCNRCFCQTARSLAPFARLVNCGMRTAGIRMPRRVYVHSVFIAASAKTRARASLVALQWSQCGRMLAALFIIIYF